ncbi:MAG: cation transporter [Candidatus Zixiibacteriota bacterium]|nr:MAG: cation transporter [candidate division Zixibacteria bacterium]
MTHDHKPLERCGQRYGEATHYRQNHDHGKTGHNHGKGLEKRRLSWVIALTGIAMVLEAVFGWITGSLALLSDAGHMLTHFGALIISLTAIYVARRPTHPSRTYGLYRVEILAALLNSVALLAITAWILHEAIQRFANPVPIATLEMMVVAVVGLSVNVASAMILWRVGHGEDLNVRSAFVHLVGDTVSSVAVVAGAVVIYFTGAVWIDPALSVLICLVILAWAYNLTRQSVSILLEATPGAISLAQVEAAMLEVPGVREVHDLHIWSITSGMHTLTAHVEVPDQALSDLQQTRCRLEETLLKKFSISHTNIQFEVAPAARD